MQELLKGGVSTSGMSAGVTALKGGVSTSGMSARVTERGWGRSMATVGCMILMQSCVLTASSCR